MSFPKTRRVLLVATVNLAVTLAILTGVELVCRYVEHVKTARRDPAQLQELPPKKPSELRVFAFGGSTVFGEPAPEVGFVAQMQHWLQRLYPNRAVDVYNFGAAGMDTDYVLRQVTRRLDDQPDLVIVITGHNEFFDPRDRVREMLKSHLATMRVLQGFFRQRLQSRRTDVMPCEVLPWDRESAAFKRRIAQFEEAVNLIVARTRERGVKLVLGTLPSNLSDWPPVYKRLAGRDQHYSDTVSGIQDLLRDGKYREASAAVSAGFRRYPEDAMLYFLRGKIQSAMRDFAAARQSFVKARDLDPFPYRATSQINSIIRKAAAGVAGVYLADLEKVYAERARNGVVGFDFMVDNCHGTPLGESISAAALMQAMTAIGFLPPSGTGGDGCCPLPTFLAEAGYLEPHSPLRLRVLLSNAKYTMKTPFLNYEAARMYLREAMREDENVWQVWANLATLSYLEGDDARGANELQRATELHHGPLDINDRRATPNLKEALEYAAGRGDCGAAY
jgi:tetratricopeptide (TPR) repeat protein